MEGDLDRPGFGILADQLPAQSLGGWRRLKAREDASGHKRRSRTIASEERKSDCRYGEEQARGMLSGVSLWRTGQFDLRIEINSPRPASAVVTKIPTTHTRASYKRSISSFRDMISA